MNLICHERDSVPELCKSSGFHADNRTSSSDERSYSRVDV
jgi:hypothetical protein